MRTCTVWMLMLILFSAAVDLKAQFDPKKVCRMEDGRLVFTLDQRWTVAQRKQISETFDIDSIVVAWALDGRTEITHNGITWSARKLDANRVQLSKEQGKSSGKRADNDKIILIDDQLLKLSAAPDRDAFPYGVNRLTRNTIVNLAGNKVRFFLPGYSHAKNVYISGTFNEWSTLQTPMQNCDSGWTVTLKLKPGKYAYKFIIDGKWTNDPFNKLRENDTYAGYNNIFFCYNYKFSIQGYPKAQKVFIAGSFNHWNQKELRMVRFNGIWTLNMYLREGTHAYKFIIDGLWITDPANKVTRPDGRGNENSFLGIGDTLYFILKGYPNAKKVVVSGNFNDWNLEELGMKKTAGGWQLPYVLAPGNYEYKFIVDGQWIIDPANPFTAGSGKTMNSLLAVKPNYWFRLDQHSDADIAIVTGSFNNWSHSDYRMELRQGTWWFPIFLKPGKYTYKYIVDKKWILDPGNKLWEDNEFGTGNSVLWIEP